MISHLLPVVTCRRHGGPVSAARPAHGRSIITVFCAAASNLRHRTRRTEHPPHEAPWLWFVRCLWPVATLSWCDRIACGHLQLGHQWGEARRHDGRGNAGAALASCLPVEQLRPALGEAPASATSRRPVRAAGLFLRSIRFAARATKGLPATPQLAAHRTPKPPGTSSVLALVTLLLANPAPASLAAAAFAWPVHLLQLTEYVRQFCSQALCRRSGDKSGEYGLSAALRPQARFLHSRHCA